MCVLGNVIVVCSHVLGNVVALCEMLSSVFCDCVLLLRSPEML